MTKDITKTNRMISKRLAKVLRHTPEDMGLVLSVDGWTNVDDVLAGFLRAGQTVTHEQLRQIVETNDKKRFSLSADGSQIRAAQGHSVSIDLKLAPSTPPPVLYHGTAIAFLEDIQTQGLRPQSRQQVHLSADQTTAHKVGQRHGRPRVLQIDTGAMTRDGHKFYQADNGVWLTDAVPPEYMTGF